MVIVMNVGHARQVARNWVSSIARKEDGFMGAYFSGSTINLSDDDTLPESSDVDIMIITKEEKTGFKLGKFVYLDVLLEVTHIPHSDIKNPEHVLKNYHLAAAFQRNTIIEDPTGYLLELHKDVSQKFQEITWVRTRCDNAFNKIKHGLDSLDSSRPLHDQVMTWLFSNGITTHVLLIAALKNPTIRLRYLAAREVLMEYGYLEIYSDMMDLLGCSHLSPDRIKAHVDSLSVTFDAAVSVSKTPFFFSSDITDQARPIAIEGSYDLINEGYHHEAVFWIIATFCRCHMILSADAPLDLQKSLQPSFDAILNDIGLYDTNDLKIRRQATFEFLPALQNVAENILLSNPDIH